MTRRHCLLLLLIAMASCDRDAGRIRTPARNENAIAAAKAAEQAFHAACDEWAAARAAGKDTSAASSKISQSYFEFRKHIKDTHYQPNNEWLLPREQIAFAGSYADAKGGNWSYLVGKGQTGVRMSAWKRAEWSDTGLPGHGFAASLSLEPYDLFDKFHVSVGTRPEVEQDLVLIPYTLGEVGGTIELRRVGDEWRFHPDRGVVGPMQWWKPFPEPSSTRPAA
jgi:hypothetical protein